MVDFMSKVNIGIKTTSELHNNIHKLLDAAKELGEIREKTEYFDITYPYFEEYLRRKQLTETNLGYTLNEVERATTIIIKQFMNMIESHENIIKITVNEQKELLLQKENKIEALSSLLEKTERENMRLAGIEEETISLIQKIEDLENKIIKMELKHDKDLNRLDKEYVRKFTNFQSLFEEKLNEVN